MQSFQYLTPDTSKSTEEVLLGAMGSYFQKKQQKKAEESDYYKKLVETAPAHERQRIIEEMVPDSVKQSDPWFSYSGHGYESKMDEAVRGRVEDATVGRAVFGPDSPAPLKPGSHPMEIPNDPESLQIRTNATIGKNPTADMFKSARISSALARGLDNPEDPEYLWALTELEQAETAHEQVMSGETNRHHQEMEGETRRNHMVGEGLNQDKWDDGAELRGLKVEGQGLTNTGKELDNQGKRQGVIDDSRGMTPGQTGALKTDLMQIDAEIKRLEKSLETASNQDPNGRADTWVPNFIEDKLNDVEDWYNDVDDKGRYVYDAHGKVKYDLNIPAQKIKSKLDGLYAERKRKIEYANNNGGDYHKQEAIRQEGQEVEMLPNGELTGSIDVVGTPVPAEEIRRALEAGNFVMKHGVPYVSVQGANWPVQAIVDLFEQQTGMTAPEISDTGGVEPLPNARHGDATDSSKMQTLPYNPKEDPVNRQNLPLDPSQLGDEGMQLLAAVQENRPGAREAFQEFMAGRRAGVTDDYTPLQ